MALSIRTNVSSLNAQRNLNQTQNQLDASLSRLSSGYRITKAGDDAAGLGISVNLQAQIRSFSQAARNAQDGISLVQTAEGSLNEISNILVRLRELGIQAASAGVGETERGYIQEEVTQLTGEIDRIIASAEFNGTKLLDGTAADLAIQVGTGTTGNDTITVAIAELKPGTTGLTMSGEDGTAATTALGTIDTAIDAVSKARAELGAVGNRLNNAINNIQTAVENLSAANSRIRDVDIAEETSQMTRAQILMQAGVSVLAQANQIPQAALKLLG